MEKRYTPEDYIYDSEKIRRITKRNLNAEDIARALQKELNTMQMACVLATYIERERREKRPNRIKITEKELKEYFEVVKYPYIKKKGIFEEEETEDNE